MKLILTQNEIDEALKAHVLSTIALRGQTDITISYTAGRGPSGLTAEIDIEHVANIVQREPIKTAVAKEEETLTADDEVADTDFPEDAPKGSGTSSLFSED